MFWGKAELGADSRGACARSRQHPQRSSAAGAGAWWLMRWAGAEEKETWE